MSGKQARSSSGDAAAPRAGRPLRADAQRNRERVLEVARETFAAEGLSVPIDEIARRAGVGAGTVYRHFPTKESLFEAVILSSIERLAAQARTLLRAREPGPAFFGFFSELLDEAGTSRALLEALAGAGVDIKTSIGDAGSTLDSILAKLFTRAQRAGAVRKDLDQSDLKALMVGALAMQNQSSPSSRHSLISVVCDGLRTTDN
jgi:AcrR family transcriptional regulator